MHRKQELSGPSSREGREHSRLTGVPGRFEASARQCQQVAVSASRALSADCSRIQSLQCILCRIWQALGRVVGRHTPVQPNGTRLHPRLSSWRNGEGVKTWRKGAGWQWLLP
jgi:hypothetical protein